MQSSSTHRDSNIQSPGNQRLLTFSSGGWVILVTAIISLGLLIWGIAPALLRSANRPPGDGKNPETFGFDLTSFRLPRAQLAAAMLHRDLVQAMTNPSVSGPDESAPPESRWTAMQKHNDLKYGKYLVSNDLVIGVEINGEARAYPISVINVHEIINDSLGGTPIAVTYNWLCSSVVVYDRRVNNRTLEFGHSGLVFNSNTLLYDRQQEPRDDGALPSASLWLQLTGQAVSGPAAQDSQRLKALAVSLVTWGQWSQMHPNTTVLNRDLRLAARYKGATPTQYLQSTELLFPVDPLPDAGTMPLKSHVIVIKVEGQSRMHAVSDLIARSDEHGIWMDSFNGTPLRFICDRQTRTVRIENGATGAPVTTRHAFWFAWYAMESLSQNGN